MNFTEINLDYAVQSNKLGQRYPALQSTDYQPRSLSTQPQFCLSSDSGDLSKALSSKLQAISF